MSKDPPLGLHSWKNRIKWGRVSKVLVSGSGALHGCSFETIFVKTLVAYADKAGVKAFHSFIFNDGTFSGWEPVPSQGINFIPMAIESMQIGGYKKENLVKVASGVDTTGFDLTGAHFTELLMVSGNVGGGTTPLTVHLPPDHSSTTSGKHTIYNLAVSGGDVYLAWTPGY